MKATPTSLFAIAKRVLLALILGLTFVAFCLLEPVGNARSDKARQPSANTPTENAVQLVTDGQRIFRFDTFGNEAFWAGALQLHQAIQGADFGGVGPGISPKTALALGLKVDVDALPERLVQQLRHGRVNLDDPAVTLQLLKLNAVLGVKGSFNPNGSLKAVGLTCALRHSTVNDSFAPGIGQRLDGWANHDLNAGAIIAASPNLKPITDVLRVALPTLTDDQVRAVLHSWGPGKFDAEWLLDGKAMRPDGGSAATLIPNAGYNLHTWTGGWSTLPYWNAFMAVLELHGAGTFIDTRLDDAAKWPIAAALGFGHTSVDNPDDDQVTSKLTALQVFLLSIPSPNPPRALTSMPPRRLAETSFLVAKPTATAVTANRSGASPVGTTTDQPR